MSDIQTEVTSIITVKPRTTTVVSVQASPTVVEVVKNQPVIEIAQLGLQGVPGPPGASGGASSAYTHDQQVPSAVWTINHLLGYRPNVTVFDTLGEIVWGSISHPSINTTVITFSAAFSGTAYLS